jgi:hypothetical protein
LSGRVDSLRRAKREPAQHLANVVRGDFRSNEFGRPCPLEHDRYRGHQLGSEVQGLGALELRRFEHCGETFVGMEQMQRLSEQPFKRLRRLGLCDRGPGFGDHSPAHRRPNPMGQTIDS